MIYIFIRYHTKNLVLQHQAKTEEDYHCRYLHVLVHVLHILHIVKKSIREFAKTGKILSKSFYNAFTAQQYYYKVIIDNSIQQFV